MNPEERLDHLLTRREPDAALSETEAAQLAAAEAIQHLQAIPIPADFAERLQAQVRARAQALREAAPTSTQGAADTLKRKYTFPLPQPMRRIFVLAVSLGLVIGLLALTLVNASAQSVPGDWLYAIKQLRNQITLAQAPNPDDKAHISLQQLQGAFADLRYEVAHHRADADIRQALSVLATAITNAQAAAHAIAAPTLRATAQAALAQELATEETGLYRLLAQVDWPVRLALSAQLHTMGAVVPHITAATVTRSHGTVVLSLQGTHFASGIQLFIDGQIFPASAQVTTTTLLAQVPMSLWDGHDHAVGVQNPDGTATEILVANGAQSNAPPSLSPTSVTHGHHHATPTPTPGHNGGA